MELLMSLVESAPVPVLLHDDQSVKTCSQHFKNLWGSDTVNNLEGCLRKIFLAGTNLDQLLAGIKECRAVQLDLTRYNKGVKSRWKASSQPVGSPSQTRCLQVTWFVDSSLGDIQASYWALHVRMNTFASELIANQSMLKEQATRLEESNAHLQEEVEERERSEAALFAAKEHAERLMFLVPSAVFTVDRQRHITTWNRMMEEITGYTKEEAIGKSCEFMGLDTCLQHCSLYSADLPKPVIAKECTIRTKSGDERTISRNVDNLYDVDGQVIGGIESFEDISERKKAYAELQNMQGQLLQAEKMATVGQLAAGVAHEINNPTGFVMGNLDVVRRYFDTLKIILEKYIEVEECLKAGVTDRLAKLLSELQKMKDEKELALILSDLPNLTEESLGGMRRIQRIVADLRSFSHSDEGHWEEADLHELIQLALNIASNEIKYKAEVVKEYGELPRIRCYPQQLSQVFLNLFVNAVHAIPVKGKITVRTFVEEDVVVVEVGDNGCGMAEDVRKRVFEPFFTTKPIGKGTGLGLSLAYNIIQKHQGEISVSSQPGQGTTFTIRLPKGGSNE